MISREWTWAHAPAWFLRFQGRWSLFFGRCPRCNDDAPMLDNCTVCESRAAHTRHRYERPSDEVLGLWWIRFVMAVRARNASAEHIRKAETDVKRAESLVAGRICFCGLISCRACTRQRHYKSDLDEAVDRLRAARKAGKK